MKKRCFGDGKDFYEEYHDKEWGVESHDDRYLFEMLILEGAQAGLSWETILRKREAYRELFHGFDPNLVAEMSDEELEGILLDARIIRNRLKVFGARKNARAFLEIQQKYGSFDKYIWRFVKGQQIVGNWRRFEEVPAETELSQKISKDLRKRGMTFVGPKIIYSFMQAVGMLNDHLQTCPSLI
jgi:DNA-3-methyladenine glycosylase I